MEYTWSCCVGAMIYTTTGRGAYYYTTIQYNTMEYNNTIGG
jgi:hypothetical protein